MFDPPEQRAAAPFLAALPSCTDHLDDLAVYEVCARGSEPELNDLLRHATNTRVRPNDWIVQREQSRTGLISRADLMMTDLPSGIVVAILEAKMVYSTDVLDAVGLWLPAFERDVTKLAAAAGTSTPPPRFLLTWVPHFAVVRRRLRYMAGHRPAGEGWFSVHDLGETRTGVTAALSRLGTGTQHVQVRESSSADGDLILDAYLTVVN